MNEEYRLRTAKTYENDLREAFLYICSQLEAPQAAKQLVRDAEEAIRKRLYAPHAFRPYRFGRMSGMVFYRINVRNVSIFYTLQGRTMMVRRFHYQRRNIDKVAT